MAQVKNLPEGPQDIPRADNIPVGSLKDGLFHPLLRDDDLARGVVQGTPRQLGLLPPGVPDKEVVGPEALPTPDASPPQEDRVIQGVVVLAVSVVEEGGDGKIHS